MITIIIPLYNKEQFIAEAIQSVLNQTFAHFEILVINDGSTDSSAAIVSQIKDERVRLISIENSGVSIARNIGIENAKFDWIALLDADDWWAPTFLFEIVEAIDNNPNEFIFATGRNRVFKKKIERYLHEYLPQDGETKVLNYYQIISKYLPLINSSNVVIHKSIFEKFGFFKFGQKQHEDHDLWLRLCIEHEVVFINKPLSLYRKTDVGSVSNEQYAASDFVTYLNTIREVYEKLSEENRSYFGSYANKFIALTYLKNYGNYSKAERKMIAPFLTYFCKGNYKKAIQISRIAPFSIYPFLKLLQR